MFVQLRAGCLFALLNSFVFIGSFSPRCVSAINPSSLLHGTDTPGERVGGGGARAPRPASSPPISLFAIDMMPATPAGISSEFRRSSKAYVFAELEHSEHAAQLTAAGHAGLAIPRTPSNRDPTRFHHRCDSGMRRLEAASTGETYDIRIGQTRGASSSW